MISDIDKSNIITTKKVDEILDKEKYALKLKRSEFLWFSGKRGVRKSGLSFAMTKSERQEYTKCKLSVFYFAQKYCQIKRDDGKIGEFKLRDYQSDIIKLFNDNRYSILMASRQSGKCLDFNTKILLKTVKNEKIITRIGKLYYYFLSQERKLNFLEKIKIKLYDILYFLERKFEYNEKNII